MAKKNGSKTRGGSDRTASDSSLLGITGTASSTAWMRAATSRAVPMPPLRDVAARWQAAGHIFEGFKKNGDLVIAKCPKCLNLVSVSTVTAQVVGLDERDGSCSGVTDRREPIPPWGTPEDFAARDARVKAQNERHRREKKLPNETLEDRAVRMRKLSTGTGRAQ